MSIALKEANETNYWIDLLHDTEYINTKMYQDYRKRYKRNYIATSKHS